MSRPANTVGTTSMTISVAPQIRQYLLDLTAKGTFGNTIQEVTRSLVSSTIQDLIAKGQLAERRWRVKEDGGVEILP
ncbi:MAG: hypothetical protein K8R87_09500 [Verrucomicrobia bacterium]|nr:hypothetical protein [Verrucomicrobiota bacterium]